MKLLHEEFFGKISNFGDKSNIFLIRMAVKIIFLLLILTGIGLIIYSFLIKNYIIIWIILGLFIIGESAHYIRKSRETTLTQRADVVNKIKKEEKVEKKDAVNKDGLLLDKKNSIKTN